MKKLMRIFMISILCLSFALPLTQAANVTPTPPPASAATIRTIEDALNHWFRQYHKAPEWAALKQLEENRDLPPAILMRLCATYILDEFPDLTLLQLADMEPRLKLVSAEGGLHLVLDAMTHDGEIRLQIDCSKGILMDVKSTSGGGNG
mgnify:FL=1